ncbi:MAG: hypothetical protein ACLP1D_23435 [Xanthobacteraceae bacterium]
MPREMFRSVRWSPPDAAGPAARSGLTGPMLAVMAGLVLNCVVAWPGRSQTAPSPPPQAPPAAAQPAPEPAMPARRPGLVDELQKLLPGPLQSWPSIGSPQETIEDLNQRARDAGDNLSRFSKQQVVAGRVKCPLAANGAPDCKVAADRLCTDNGFKGGRSIDSDSAENCPASVILSDKPPEPANCQVENFVIRALCQR